MKVSGTFQTCDDEHTPITYVSDHNDCPLCALRDEIYHIKENTRALGVAVRDALAEADTVLRELKCEPE